MREIYIGSFFSERVGLFVTSYALMGGNSGEDYVLDIISKFCVGFLHSFYDFMFVFLI